MYLDSPPTNWSPVCVCKRHQKHTMYAPCSMANVLCCSNQMRPGWMCGNQMTVKVYGLFRNTLLYSIGSYKHNWNTSNTCSLPIHPSTPNKSERESSYLDARWFSGIQFLDCCLCLRVPFGVCIVQYVQYENTWKCWTFSQYSKQASIFTISRFSILAQCFSYEIPRNVRVRMQAHTQWLCVVANRKYQSQWLTWSYTSTKQRYSWYHVQRMYLCYTHISRQSMLVCFESCFPVVSTRRLIIFTACVAVSFWQ